MTMTRKPIREGLYDSRFEHDACGVGFVAHIKNEKSHEIIEKGLEILVRLTHRGAVGADPREGDGAGILIQLPDAFFRSIAPDLGIELPPEGRYAVAQVFFQKDEAKRAKARAIFEQTLKEEGLRLLGWRRVPTDAKAADLPPAVVAREPVIEQAFIACPEDKDQDAFERKLFVARKVISRRVREAELDDPAAFYICSMSSRTIVYKGMFLSHQLPAYYADLRNPKLASALALVHQRFSTNTLPAWELAHPFRMIAHNGEINTLRGNINWMNARRHSMKSKLLGKDLEKIWPVIAEGQSDTACFDNALELLVMGGYELAHAAMMMIPEAWNGNPLMDEERRAFYEYHAALMEPWDGPAAVVFTDGRKIGAMLDRNGLRPARYLITSDDLVIGASEAGVLDVPEEKIVKKWRLQPGKMFLVDLEQGRIVDDDELKKDLARRRPYREWLKKTQIRIEELPEEIEPLAPDHETLLPRQRMFGYTIEDLKMILAPMAISGQEPVGSMGNDTPLAVLSNRPRLIYDYFRQMFAQVTNPPIDPIREEMVMDLTMIIGPRPNLLAVDHTDPWLRLEVSQPILSRSDMEKIRHIEQFTNGRFRSVVLSICYPAEEGASGMEKALERLCAEAEEAVRAHANILILSDRDAGKDRIAIPDLLALSAVHHHLIRKGLRTEVGLVVETGQARAVHHFCTLAGYGAEAMHPYLAFDTIADLKREGILPEDLSEEEAIARYIKAIDKGILKTMSKMGISTYQSYCGAQIFEAVGLSRAFVDRYFTGTPTQVEGAGLEEIAEETFLRHKKAWQGSFDALLDVGGEYAWRTRGEDHLLTPENIAKLQHAIRTGNYELYKEFARSVNEQAGRLKTLRGLFRFKKRKPIPIDEVEPVEAIVKRFSTGAMSFGSISEEAHTTLAIAMNRIGGKSNTGEGGEEPERFKPLPNGDSARSAIKQVASGRFGVTTEYLVNADRIQIKIAQGAKPGEGGQLPGHKVDRRIARVRHSTPGVGLISPPPHHDIYSIEDLAQLIFDLKNTNPQAEISVKLVAEIGVGTIAAGVVKGKADHVVIAGHDGGTGASPLSSIKHAGSPWELGLAETQQVLVRNRLRSRARIEVDGQIRTGRDVVIAALLGADEVAFGTIALVAVGCIMMRKCHLNTCPVGVATQDPELRKKFVGKPEHLINYMYFVAQEVRELMAELGFRTFDEMIGKAHEVLEVNEAIKHWKSKGLDLSPLLAPPPATDEPLHHAVPQKHAIDDVLDRRLIAEAKEAIEKGKPVRIEVAVKNTDRTIGAMLSGEVAKRWGHAGLAEDTIYIRARGVAGQSFGAWLARGITLELEGEANDYVGKGLSGGKIIIYPPKDSPIVPEENIIVGNTVLFGAIEGECYFRGVAGERFAVRNSGAIAVVEGVGDHGCEYMTGGTVVVLGRTGKNFAAGMSGGIAYVLDLDGDFERRCNLAQVELEPVLSEAEALEAWEHQGPDLETHGRVDIRHRLDQNDEAILRTLIARHARLTGSTVAEEILANWAKYRHRVVRVMPIEYRRALAELEAERKKAEEAVHG